MPLDFKHRTIEGEPFVVVHAKSAPLYMLQGVFERLVKWVERRPSCGGEEMLALVGSIKSGKTTALFTLLPDLIARFHQQQNLPSPVFSMFDFREGESAEANCSALHTALHYAAAKLDVVIPLCATNENKAIVVDFSMKIFAEKMHDQGRVLHVLLDEMQAPVLASLPSDALLFVSTIKCIV
jgi:hypothetical protein